MPRFVLKVVAVIGMVFAVLGLVEVFRGNPDVAAACIALGGVIVLLVATGILERSAKEVREVFRKESTKAPIERELEVFQRFVSLRFADLEKRQKTLETVVKELTEKGEEGRC